jgi:hypothetical protein
MGVFFLCSWFESLATALHLLQPDSLFCFSCLVVNSSFLLSLSQILHLPRTSFAAVIRPLFNQFIGGHSVK